MEMRQLTTLFSNAVLGRLEQMRVNPMQRLTSRLRGDHLSGRGGRSTEFADYRDYSPGDDTRFIDWNIYSRLRRPYLKLYQVEEEMHVLIIIDASESMVFEGKLEMAKRLAAAFGVMGLYGGERVSLYAFSDQAQPLQFQPAMQGRFNLKNLFDFTESVAGSGSMPFETGVDHVVKHHRGKGVVVLLSDFMTMGNASRAFNSLFSCGLEICAIQILAPVELEPDLTSDLRLVDCETADTLDVSAIGSLLEIYHEHKVAFQEELARQCRQRSGRFISISSEAALEDVLFNNLLRKGWIK